MCGYVASLISAGLQQESAASEKKLRQKFFDAIDKAADRKRFEEVLDVGLEEESVDLEIGTVTGNEDETVSDFRPVLLGGFEEFVALELGHEQVADDSVILVGADFFEGFDSVVGHIN
jgi:hypothetical protein